jgi:hypothetical protein
MTMQIDNKGDSLNDNLWAEMSLMTAVVVMQSLDQSFEPGACNQATDSNRGGSEDVRKQYV